MEGGKRATSACDFMRAVMAKPSEVPHSVLKVPSPPDGVLAFFRARSQLHGPAAAAWRDVMIAYKNGDTAALAHAAYASVPSLRRIPPGCRDGAIKLLERFVVMDRTVTAHRPPRTPPPSVQASLAAPNPAPGRHPKAARGGAVEGGGARGRRRRQGDRRRLRPAGLRPCAGPRSGQRPAGSRSQAHRGAAAAELATRRLVGRVVLYVFSSNAVVSA